MKIYPWGGGAEGGRGIGNEGEKILVLFYQKVAFDERGLRSNGKKS